MSMITTRVWRVKIKPSKTTKIIGFFPGKITVMADTSVKAMELVEERFGGWRVFKIEEVFGKALIWDREEKAEAKLHDVAISPWELWRTENSASVFYLARITDGLQDEYAYVYYPLFNLWKMRLYEAAVDGYWLLSKLTEADSELMNSVFSKARAGGLIE